jgi:hypothetical protein
LLAYGSGSTYARLGQNDDQGHAVGLGKWKLSCPRFHQYRFESATILNNVLKCASTAPVLIIANSIVPEPESNSPTWNDFVAGVEQIAKGYSCDASSGLRICVRPDLQK